MSSPSSTRADPWPELPQPTRVFRLLLLAAQKLRYWMDRRLAEAGLTTQQATLLTVLADLGGSAVLGEVADRLAMTHQNVKQIAASLEAKGFLGIEVDAKDRRARRLRPTPRSRRFWKRRGDLDERAIAALMESFTADELALLARLLLELARAAGSERRSART